MNTITVPVKKLDESLEAPAYAYLGDAGLDLRASEDAILEPFERETVPCGIAIAIPEGYAGFVMPRSGLASKHGISIVNSPGLIDSNYRGEVKVVLVNLDAHETFRVSRGDRIAQLVIMSVPAVDLQVVEQLDETMRGESGFGSSGVMDGA